MQRRQSREPDSRHHRYHAYAEDGRAPHAKHSPGEATTKDPWGVRKASRFSRRGTRNAIDPNWAVNILDPSISGVLEKRPGCPRNCSRTAAVTDIPPGSANPSSRAAILTLLP